MLLKNKIKKFNWAPYWFGRWSVLTCLIWGSYYTKQLKTQLGEGLENVLIIHREGYSECYFDKTERERFGNFLVQRVLNDNSFVVNLCAEIKQKADGLMAWVKKNENLKIDNKKFKEYLKIFKEYSGPHISPRNIIDFLPAKYHKKFLPPLTKIRIYTEKVFEQTEKFVNKHKLSKHSKVCAMFFSKAGLEVVTGKKAVAELEKVVLNIKNIASITGTVAYPGKITGRARIVFDPKGCKDFKDGEALVTGMTRPDYLPLMHKAGAIITDGGGLLCHAAIVAREWKKPTIIETQHATKILKDGQLVEVDADKGSVTVIKT